MSKFQFATLAVLAASGAVSAQDYDLLFTGLQQERTLSNTFPGSLQRLLTQDAAVVHPAGPVGAYTAEKMATHLGWLMLAGDTDNDGVFNESVLTEHVDAVTAWRPAGEPNMFGVLFSPAVVIQGCVSGGPFQPGDVGRIRPGGQFEYFLTEGQIRTAFQIPANEAINVDAITYDQQRLQGGAYAGRHLVYLSLEDDHTGQFRDLNGNVVANAARDGAILAIPVNSLALPVAGVFAGSGVLVASEARVDDMVDKSQVKDAVGMHPVMIGDTDGLDLDPNGGTYNTSTGIYPNLLFCGETLTGGGVLTTRANPVGNGRIALLNGQALASSGAATTGAQVGLRPGDVGSLNGLHASAQHWSRFVIDSPTPLVLCPPGGPIQIDIGGGTPGGVAFLGVGIAADVACTAAPMFALPNAGFPYVIPAAGFVAVALAADGTGSFVGNLPCAAAPGVNLTFQAAKVGAAGAALSSPLTVELQ